MANVTRATLAAAAQLAEIQHGDWKTVSFQGTVGTADPSAACEFRITAVRQQPNALLVTASDCSLHNARLEVFDANGRRIFGQTLTAADGTAQVVTMSTALSSGFYFATITQAQSSVTQKFLVP